MAEEWMETVRWKALECSYTENDKCLNEQFINGIMDDKQNNKKNFQL